MSLFVQKRPVPSTTQPPLCVRGASIGRSNAGKSGLQLAVSKVAADTHLPSGVFFSGGAPLEVAERLKRDREQIKEIKLHGLPSTIEESTIDYELHEGDDCRIKFNTQECIGQILTNTTSASPPDQQRRYQKYVERLKSSDVLWAVVAAPPPNASADDRDRLDYDLRLTNTYLREGLRQHAGDHSCSVAIIVSKIDTLFDSADEARDVMTDDALRDALSPLVRTVEQSNKVAQAVIAPTSAYGWGRAVMFAESEKEPRQGEPAWLLRPEATLDPFNVISLMTWTLLAGVLPKEVDCSPGQELAIARVARNLADDLGSLEAWLVPVKGGLLC